MSEYLQCVEDFMLLTTERCNLSCMMCPYHGPEATRRSRTLDPQLARRYLESVPAGKTVIISSLGEYLMDPSALDHLRLASERGLTVSLITNGQLLTPSRIEEILAAGVRYITISVDAIDPEAYASVRRGGRFERILEACKNLRRMKADYPDLIVSIANVLLEDTKERQSEFVRFWEGKVDAVFFQAELYDGLKLRNLLFEPDHRTPCRIKVQMIPSGKLVPCGPVAAHQHEHPLDWLPDMESTTLEEAHRQFTAMYEDPASPLRQVCAQCDGWKCFHADEQGRNPFYRMVRLNGDPAPPAPSEATSHSLPVTGVTASPVAAPSSPVPLLVEGRAVSSAGCGG